MAIELPALADNHIWFLVDLPYGKVPIRCKWLNKIKYNMLAVFIGIK